MEHIDNIPEEKRWRKGGSKRRYCFTLEDIALCVGRSVQTVRNHKAVGKLDFGKLRVLAEYMGRFR